MLGPTTACLLLLVGGAAACLAAEADAPGSPRKPLEATRGPADLVVPPAVPEGETRRYGLVFPFQVGPRMAAVSCNLRVHGVNIGDFEDGADVVLFDDLSRISARGAIPITRNEKVVDPATGKRRYVVKFPVIGGFVPLGARREDGSPHPDAGTGFGICEALSFPMTEAGYFTWADKWLQQLEVIQLAYDGKQLRVLRAEAKSADAPLTAPGSDWAVTSPGLSQAIPDGDDLLYPLMARKGDANVSGVSRWHRRSGAWRLVAFTPVTEQAAGWYEPSLIRDNDGSLLFSARIDQPRLRVWRSKDSGATWEQAIDVKGEREPSPVTLNRTASGIPYIAANPLGHGREAIALWPLSEDRSALGTPITARDARAEFGPPPSGSQWMMDHPTGVTLRLRDGRWRHVLAYRIRDTVEHGGIQPAQQTGAYVEEILSPGPIRPPWRF